MDPTYGSSDTKNDRVDLQNSLGFVVKKSQQFSGYRGASEIVEIDKAACWKAMEASWSLVCLSSPLLPACVVVFMDAGHIAFVCMYLSCLRPQQRWCECELGRFKRRPNMIYW